MYLQETATFTVAYIIQGLRGICHTSWHSLGILMQLVLLWLFFYVQPFVDPCLCLGSPGVGA